MSITYETQIFFPSKDPPFWIAKYENIIKDQESATLVAICEFPPFNNDNKALIYGCIQYCSDKMYSLPLLPIIINTMDLFSMDTDMSFKMSANFGNYYVYY